MRKLFFLFGVATIMIFSGCGDSDERPESYFTVNGERLFLGEGFIYDWGTNNQITTRNYDIELCDSESAYANYIEFTISSNSTTRLQEGTYSYKQISEKGFFTSPKIGMNIKYDGNDVAISGTRLKEFDMANISGDIVVTQEEGDYKFVIDMKFEVDGKPYVIYGEYWGALKSYTY